MRFPDREDPRERFGMDTPRPDVEAEYLQSMRAGSDEYRTPRHPAVADREGHPLIECPRCYRLVDVARDGSPAPHVWCEK